MNSFAPAFVALAILGIFGLGAIFGAWIVESQQRKIREPLMHLTTDPASAPRDGRGTLDSS